MSTRILVVDDEAAIRLTLPAFLTRHGYDVIAVGTVREALADIQARRSDVLICDLNIHEPGDGFTVLTAMHAAQPNGIKMILTGYPALETAQRAIDLHVDAYITKPAEPAALLLAIERRVEERQRGRVAAAGG
jgi:DNA-binding NtrC family response regulator